MTHRDFSLLGFLLIAFTLGGCTAPAVKYKEGRSEAWNITNAAGFYKLKDAELPEGVEDPNKYSLSDAFWDSGYASMPYWGGGLTGLVNPQEALLNLLAIATRPKDREADRRIFGWMPKTMADNPEGALQQLGVILTDAAEKALKETGTVFEQTPPDDGFATSFRWTGDNCFEGWVAPCFFSVRLNDEPSEWRFPAWKGGGEAYYFNSKNAVWAFPYTKTPTKKDELGRTWTPSLRLNIAFSKSLPEWLFIYLPSNYVYVDKDNTKLNPTPIVLSQGRVLFFVKPRAN